MQKIFAVGENGLRVGEDHPLAKLSNHDIDRLLQLREEGWGYTRLANVFEISRRSVRDICNGRRRCAAIAAFKTVRVADADGS